MQDQPIHCPFCAYPSFSENGRGIFSCGLCGARGPKRSKMDMFENAPDPVNSWTKVAKIVQDHRAAQDRKLTRLRGIIGTGPTRSLQLGCSVLKVWRRSTPWNWWVENKHGKTLWHSNEYAPVRLDLQLFERVNDSDHRIGDGLQGLSRALLGSECGKPEQTIYKLKQEFMTR